MRRQRSLFAGDQPRFSMRPATAEAQRPVRHPRRRDPAHEGDRHFGHEFLLAAMHGFQKGRTLAINFVKREPLELHAIGYARSYSSKAI